MLPHHLYAVSASSTPLWPSAPPPTESDALRAETEMLPYEQGKGRARLVRGKCPGAPECSRVLPSHPRVLPSAPECSPVIPECSRVLPSAPRVLPGAPRVLPSHPRVLPECSQSAPSAPHQSCTQNRHLG